MMSSETALLIFFSFTIYTILGGFVAGNIIDEEPSFIRRDILNRPTFPVIVAMAWPLVIFGILLMLMYWLIKQLYIDWFKSDSEDSHDD